MDIERDNTSWDPDQLRRQLQAMDDYDFEHLVGDLWELQGWETEVEQQSSDAGVDVRATKTSPYYRKVLIQAKRYSDDNPVSGPAVQQYSALKQQESDVDESIIVTTGRFTGSAEERGKDLNVKLIDGHDLVAIIDDLNAYDVVERYIKYPRASDTQPVADQTHSLRSSRSSRSTLPSEERAKIEEHIGQDIDAYLQDDEYRAIRAKERAQSRVELNPHDAKELGIFDNLPLYDFEREFTERKTQLVLLKDDVHIDDGEVYIEDLTDYIDVAAIEGAQSGAVIGVIRRGVPDGAWMSEEGKKIWRNKKRIRRFGQIAQKIISLFKTNDTQRAGSSQTESQKSGNINQELASTEAKRGAEGEVNPETTGINNSLSTDIESPNQDSPDQQSNRIEAVESTPDTEASVTTETEIRRTPTTTHDLSRTRWFYGVVAGTAGWVLVWGLFAVLSNAGAIGGLVTIISWLLLPVSLFLDTRKTGVFSTSKWTSIAYIVLSTIPLFAVIPGTVYLYRRENSWNT